ncbi:MAG: DUF1801 domain-containing protein [Bacteroidota bacterium]
MLDIDWYLARASTETQVILTESCHHLLMSIIPRCKIQRKWSLPFYTYLKDLCYINYYKDHLYLSFLQGQDIVHPLVEKESTKRFGKFYVTKQQDIDGDALPEIILQAIALQEHRYRK